VFLEGNNPYFPSKTPRKLPKRFCVGLSPSVVALLMSYPVYDKTIRFEHKLTGSVINRPVWSGFCDFLAKLALKPSFLLGSTWLPNELVSLAGF